MTQKISQRSTGIEGLDELLRGGVINGRMYLISGDPGTGKTTLGMHFLERSSVDWRNQEH